MVNTSQVPLDELIPRELSRDAKLFNFKSAPIVKFFNKTALYLPVAISDSPQGRMTVYKLPQGQKTLMGLYIFDSRVILDYYTRLSDELYYIVSKETISGEVLFSGSGRLNILDDRVGAGEIIVELSVTPDPEAAAAAAPVKCKCKRRWYVWSFIGTEDCDCTGGRPGILD